MRWTTGLFFLANIIIADSIIFNTPSNHGSLGIINLPSARFYDSPSMSFSMYRGSPDRKISLTAYPYDWLEATLFYTSIKDEPYANGVYSQDLKDKGFNLKFKLKEEGYFPAIAVGLNDLGGTGYYSSEYIVSSYSFDNLDIHFGASWGQLSKDKYLKNPMSVISERFKIRDDKIDQGGKFNFKNFFSGEYISLFGGINYVVNNSTVLKIEYDPTVTPGLVGYETTNSPISLAVTKNIQNNLSLTVGYERGNSFIINASLREFFPTSQRKYVRKNFKDTRSPYSNLRKILKMNQIGVSKIEKNKDQLNIHLTQNTYNDLIQLNNFVDKAISESSLVEEVVKTYKIAGLTVIEPPWKSKGSKKIFENKYSGINSGFSFKIRPFIAGREDFLKLALLLEHDTEFIFSENLFFSTNLKISLIDNFDDLIYPPVDVYPEQVRSDIKKYLNNIGENVSIGRAQLEYFKTFAKNNHILLTAGIYEEMFSGFGFEYLTYDHNKNFSYGFEVHKVYKRDYEFLFGLNGYENITYHTNLYYENDFILPFIAKLSFGEYLAGDKGTTLQFSRAFKNGVEFGFFASLTNVTSEQFGEGSFDKGIFFKIPFGRNNNISSFEWKPLTKDPAQKLIRKNSIYQLVKMY